MEQEKTMLSAPDDIRILPSSASASNGVATATPTPTHVQADALPELTTAELVRYDRHRIKNLKGGILAWADQVDRSMQKY